MVSFGTVAVPPVKAVGAVRFAAAGNTFFVVMTGSDGIVRYATAPAVSVPSDTVSKSDSVSSSAATPGTATVAHSPRFGAWRTLQGVSSVAEPAVVGRTSGGAEVYAVSSTDSLVHRAVFSPSTSTWSPWSALSGVGTTQLAGAPAAVALDANHTELLVASASGSLVTASGPGAADGGWQAWRSISAAGAVKPGVALTTRSDGAQAAYVIRASDLAVLRLVNNGSSAYTWGPIFPTGAVGQPEASYTAAGKPYLFVQAISNDVQVYEPSGANLRGTQSWAPVGVTSHNPPGVAALPDQRLIVSVTAEDGSVRLYASTV